MTVDEAGDRAGDRRVVREEDRLAVGAVLGLREQVRGDPAASAVASAITTTSLGPAGRSMRTRLDTRTFAAVTYGLPGPTIASTGSIVSVP